MTWRVISAIVIAGAIACVFAEPPVKIDDQHLRSPESQQQQPKESEQQEEDVNYGWQDSVPGLPGRDYPNLSTIPRTSFTCADKTPGGYYADVETRCQVFHVCSTAGTKSSFLCPSGSIFNQRHFVCDWWYDFICETAPEYYSLNDGLDDPESSTDRPPAPSPPLQSNSLGGGNNDLSLASSGYTNNLRDEANAIYDDYVTTRTLAASSTRYTERPTSRTTPRSATSHLGNTASATTVSGFTHTTPHPGRYNQNPTTTAYRTRKPGAADNVPRGFSKSYYSTEEPDPEEFIDVPRINQASGQFVNNGLSTEADTNKNFPLPRENNNYVDYNNYNTYNNSKFESYYQNQEGSLIPQENNYVKNLNNFNRNNLNYYNKNINGKDQYNTNNEKKNNTNQFNTSNGSQYNNNNTNQYNANYKNSYNQDYTTNNQNTKAFEYTTKSSNYYQKSTEYNNNDVKTTPQQYNNNNQNVKTTAQYNNNNNNNYYQNPSDYNNYNNDIKSNSQYNINNDQAKNNNQYTPNENKNYYQKSKEYRNYNNEVKSTTYSSTYGTTYSSQYSNSNNDYKTTKQYSTSYNKNNYYQKPSEYNNYNNEIKSTVQYDNSKNNEQEKYYKVLKVTNPPQNNKTVEEDEDDEDFDPQFLDPSEVEWDRQTQLEIDSIDLKRQRPKQNYEYNYNYNYNNYNDNYNSNNNNNNNQQQKTTVTVAPTVAVTRNLNVNRNQNNVNNNNNYYNANSNQNHQQQQQNTKAVNNNNNYYNINNNNNQHQQQQQQTTKAVNNNYYSTNTNNNQQQATTKIINISKSQNVNVASSTNNNNNYQTRNTEVTYKNHNYNPTTTFVIREESLNARRDDLSTSSTGNASPPYQAQRVYPVYQSSTTAQPPSLSRPASSTTPVIVSTASPPTTFRPRSKDRPKFLGRRPSGGLPSGAGNGLPGANKALAGSTSVTGKPTESNSESYTTVSPTTGFTEGNRQLWEASTWNSARQSRYDDRYQRSTSTTKAS